MVAQSGNGGGKTVINIPIVHNIYIGSQLVAQNIVRQSFHAAQITKHVVGHVSKHGAKHIGHALKWYFTSKW
jgi:hypothetical protein